MSRHDLGRRAAVPLVSVIRHQSVTGTRASSPRGSVTYRHDRVSLTMGSSGGSGDGVHFFGQGTCQPRTPPSCGSMPQLGSLPLNGITDGLLHRKHLDRTVHEHDLIDVVVRQNLDRAEPVLVVSRSSLRVRVIQGATIREKPECDI